MKNLLFVGENPYATTGNAKMLRYVLKQIDFKAYCVHVFSIDSVGFDPLAVLARPVPFPIVSSLVHEKGGYEEPKGTRRLLEILSRKNIDIVVFVGVDIWQYAGIYQHLEKIRSKTGMVWGGLFPYDQQKIRKDWLKWFNSSDFPCVYSKFGYDLLKESIPRLRYFRPDIPAPNEFSKSTPKKKERTRKMYFPGVKPESIVFGFFGPNQFRKDPQKLVQAFAKLTQDPELEGRDLRLYMHTDEAETGVHNLTQVAIDSGLPGEGELMIKKPGDWFTDSQISQIMNSVDCILNCSMQEGLSWTVIEAMYCGIPVICSYSTSHIELLEGTENIGVPCLQESSLPSITASGSSFIPTLSCAVDDIYQAMKTVVLDAGLRKRMGESGLKKITEWSKRRSNINDLLGMVDAEIESAKAEKEARRKEAQYTMMFAQHSSAGDILMTTKCLKGLRERHPDLKLVYMTQKKYWDIVEGNPYIDEIIDWDESNLQGRYKIVYNPHGERILPAGWGRNSNSLLSDFYWKILDVPNGGFVIVPEEPDESHFYLQPLDIAQDDDHTKCKPICIVHTQGADAEFRVYKYMADVVEAMEAKGYQTIQVGGENDYPAGADIDFCGRLTYRETAWLIQRAQIAVTVDSFISHLVGAMGVSQVCLFGSGNANVVKPDQVRGELICMEPDYVIDCPGLGPCSAAVRDCAVKCTGRHDPKDIIKAIETIERKEGGG